jgi:hypothetical protein
MRKNVFVSVSAALLLALSLGTVWAAGEQESNGVPSIDEKYTGAPDWAGGNNVDSILAPAVFDLGVKLAFSKEYGLGTSIRDLLMLSGITIEKDKGENRYGGTTERYKGDNIPLTGQYEEKFENSTADAASFTLLYDGSNIRREEIAEISTRDRTVFLRTVFNPETGDASFFHKKITWNGGKGDNYELFLSRPGEKWTGSILLSEGVGYDCVHIDTSGNRIRILEPTVAWKNNQPAGRDSKYVTEARIAFGRKEYVFNGHPDGITRMIATDKNTSWYFQEKGSIDKFTFINDREMINEHFRLPLPAGQEYEKWPGKHRIISEYRRGSADDNWKLIRKTADNKSAKEAGLPPLIGTYVFAVIEGSAVDAEVTIAAPSATAGGGYTGPGITAMRTGEKVPVRVTKHGHISREIELYNQKELVKQYRPDMGSFDMDPRTCVIATEPSSGVDVYINGELEGPSPVSVQFNGRKNLEIEVQKEGFDPAADTYFIDGKGETRLTIPYDVEQRVLHIRSKRGKVPITVKVGDQVENLETPGMFTYFGNETVTMVHKGDKRLETKKVEEQYTPGKHDVVINPDFNYAVYWRERGILSLGLTGLAVGFFNMEDCDFGKYCGVNGGLFGAAADLRLEGLLANWLFGGANRGGDMILLRLSYSGGNFPTPESFREPEIDTSFDYSILKAVAGIGYGRVVGFSRYRAGFWIGRGIATEAIRFEADPSKDESFFDIFTHSIVFGIDSEYVVRPALSIYAAVTYDYYFPSGDPIGDTASLISVFGGVRIR